jgi:hypothetical protein
MVGPKRDNDEVDRRTYKWTVHHEQGTYISLLVLPAAVGLYLVVEGIPDGAYLQVAIGLLLLICAPFLARRIVSKAEFGGRDKP